jgi:hypothetical protein
MYKCCDSLEDQPLEIGRMKAYARGWLENESIYTHMEYKWLLEILRSGLYDQFFEDCRKTLVPFIEPEIYGRSTLENCSFIVSSAFPDERLHGQSYQPRLSGMTCEFLHIWTIMTAGQQPFFLDQNGNLKFSLKPSLPHWLFTKDQSTHQLWDEEYGWHDIEIPADSLAFKFAGRTLVIYQNATRRPTYGEDGVKVSEYRLFYKDGNEKRFSSKTIDTRTAQDLRSGQVQKILATLS